MNRYYQVKWAEGPGSHRERTFSNRREARAFASNLVNRSRAARSSAAPHPLELVFPVSERGEYAARMIDAVHIVTMEDRPDGSVEPTEIEVLPID